MKRAASVAGLAAILIGVPVFLVRLSGTPHVPSFKGISLTDSYLSPQLVLDILAFVVWIAYAYFVLAVALRLVVLVLDESRGGSPRVLAAASGLLAPASLLRFVDVALAGSILAASLAGTRGATTIRPPTVAAAELVQSSHASPTSHEGRAERETYVVRAGDSLWRIAEKRLGSGFRWREIYDLNRGLRFGNGEKLRDPRLIRPGWTLTLPSQVKEHKRPARSSLHSIPIPAPRLPVPTPFAVPHNSRQPSGPVAHLPSGLALASTFVAGLLSAELLARLRRRRALNLEASTVRVEEEPDLIRHMRHVGPAPIRLELAVTAVTDEWRRTKQSEPKIACAHEGTRKVTLQLVDPDGGPIPGRSGGNLSPALEFKRQDSLVTAEVRGPFIRNLEDTPRASSPFVPLGADRGGVIHLSLTSIGILAVTGSRAVQLVRDIILSLAATNTPDDVKILLLGDMSGLAALSLLPHVQAVPLELAAQELQAEYVRRARLFSEEDVEDIGEHDLRHSDDRLPRLILVATSPPAQMHGVLEALGRGGEAFGGSLIAVGWSPQLADVAAITEEGSVQVSSHLPIPSRLSPLGLDDKSVPDAIEVIRRAWPEEEETDEVETSPTAASPMLEEPGETAATQPPPAVTELPVSAMIDELPRFPTPRTEEGNTPLVRCLGPYLIERGERVISKGWRSKAKEMLAYLVVHPEGASKDRLIDMLWPDLGPEATEREFKRSAAIIRSQVRISDESRKFVAKVGDSFSLEAGAWGADAWDFTNVVERSKEAPEDVERELLASALDLYRGDFCSDCYYSWAEPIREKYRRMFLRASARLAELVAASGDLEQALSILDRAIEIDPVNEELHRRAMGIEAAAGRVDDAKARFRRLEAVLAAEIGADPSNASIELIREIESMTVRRPADYLEIVRRLESDDVAVASGNIP